MAISSMFLIVLAHGATTGRRYVKEKGREKEESVSGVNCKYPLRLRDSHLLILIMDASKGRIQLVIGICLSHLLILYQAEHEQNKGNGVREPTNVQLWMRGENSPYGQRYRLQLCRPQ